MFIIGIDKESFMIAFSHLLKLFILTTISYTCAFGIKMPTECFGHLGIGGLVDHDCLRYQYLIDKDQTKRSPASIQTKMLNGQMSRAQTWGNYPQVENPKYEGMSGTYGNYILVPDVPIHLQKTRLKRVKTK